ncbi:MAG TPA: class I SAM-dependent methyltransferase [Smithella sp.]|nr:class I SAM-dependent methyltransferase [Smithella sp.]
MLVTCHDVNMEEWEKRGILYGSSCKSVLFKNMPEAANRHFHFAHLNFIFDSIHPVKKDCRILDVGCGWGRITMPVAQKLPEAEIIGMDISPAYVSLYKKNTGKNAFVGSLEKIPEDIGLFDLIISVTVMMYVQRNQRPIVIKNLLEKLNSGGKLILIEPDISGINYQTGFGILNYLKNNASSGNIHTGGRCFSSAELTNLIQASGGLIIKEERIPATTFFFLPMYILGKLLPEKIAAFFFRPLNLMDHLLKKYRLPTLWLFYLIQK